MSCSSGSLHDLPATVPVRVRPCTDPVRVRVRPRTDPALNGDGLLISSRSLPLKAGYWLFPWSCCDFFPPLADWGESLQMWPCLHLQHITSELLFWDDSLLSPVVPLPPLPPRTPASPRLATPVVFLQQLSSGSHWLPDCDF